MIRIRKRDRSAITLPPDALFVELVDDYGQILQVFTEDKRMHGFVAFGHPSERADMYSKYFNVEFVKSHYDLGDGKQLKLGQGSKDGF